MARHCWRHGWPAILLALVLVGSGQAVDVDSKLNERKQSTGFESNSLQDNGFFPDTPKDLMVELSCQNEGFFTWDYTSNTEGFLATICSLDGDQCISKTIRASARNFTVKLPKPDAGLTVSLWAYWKLLFIRIFSEPASIEFSSYPKVPDIKSLTVTPLNYSAIQATWKEEWAHEIKFLVCRTPKECLVRMVQGKLRQHTFNGLAPEREYTIFALAQVTLKNKTCHGPPESRTAQTFAKQPGPVLNLKYEIVNSVILNATWDAPNGTHAVDGYTIECKDIKGTYDVARDVIETESSVTATLLLRKFARTFKCSVWAFINSTLHGSVNGTKTMFEVATHNLESPVGLNVIVDCENQANATWNYERRVPITGFVVNLCWMNGSLCENKTLSPTTEEVSYELQENDARYNISVAAFVDDSLQTIHSSPTTEEFFSFPKLPDLKSLTLTPLNYSAIKATWKEEWAHEIIFLVCNTPKECKKHFVEGTLRQHTFNGLTPDSAYTISAQAQVALNNKTCQGPPESRTAPTFPSPPGPVLNLKYEIVDSVFLNANWDAPNDTKPVDGYTIECRDVEGAYDVARDVFEIKSSVNVTLPLVKFASTFNCSVWAFTNSSLHGRANGTKTVFEVATPNLEPPVDLNVVVHCENQASITWNYELGVSITGFVANLCWMNGSVCKNRTIPGPFREVSYRLQEYGALYTISVVAYVDNILQTIYSWPTTAKFFSFPKLPELDGLSVSALNSTALHAIWKEKWDHEIEFQVCTTAYYCQNDTVLGTLQQHTFSGLQPDTEYNVSAHSEVTLNNRTCKGPLQNRSAATFAEAPGPVSNLKHKIVNSVFLNAEWDAPNDTKHVDGYTIECKDIDGVYDVARDVFQTKSSVNVTLHLVEFASTFNCSVWAFIYSSLHKRVNGTKTVFEVATPNLEPPVDLNVIVDCENEANVTWNYELGVSITGFLAKICWMNGSVCKNRTLPGPARDVSYRLQEYGALYTISLVAYVDNSLQTIYSRPTTENFSSFPKLPELHGLSVSALNSTALRAIWKEKWSHEIEFYVCTTPYDCQNNTVPGTLLQHIFSSLQPDTGYNVSAQAEVTLNNRTCKGPLQSHSASTFPEVPANVTDLKHHVQNGIILVASWNSPKEAKAVKGYTISCIDSKTGKNVTADVDTLERSVQVRLNLHEPVGGFECSVWAYNKNKKGQRVLGPNRTFEVTTNGIFAPRDVKLFQRTATSLTYTWIADPTAPGWNITPVAKGQLACSGIEEYGESDNKTVTHNVTSLLPWTTYNVSIVNCRPTFCSEPTFVQSTTDVAAPSEVRDLDYTIVEDVHVRLTWKEPEHPNGPIDGYSVAVFNEDQQEGTIYDVEGRLNETTIDLDYQFNIFNICVRAYNVDKVRRDTIGGPVSEVEFETLGEGPMPPRPKFGAIGSDSVYLSWEFPEDPRYNITGFKISVSHKKPFITHERNFTVTSLEPWMDYNVSVASCTNATECGQEYDRHFKTDVGEPSEPLDFKVGFASTNGFLLEWKQPKVHNGPLSGYNVTLKKDEGEVQETTTQLSYNFTGLTAGTAYKVSVYAFNDGITTSKRGPGTTLWAATLSEKTSTPTILLATFIPLIILFALVAAFYLYKRYQKRPGDRQPLTAAEGH